MECTACGARIDQRAAFCSKCGEITRSGQPFGQKLGNTLFELSEELGKLVNLSIDFVTDESNRKKVIGGGFVIAFLLIVLTENPISSGVTNLFKEKEPELQLTEEGLPDFANYSDIFLSEEMEFFVMGKANVRDYPTSQGTQVIKALAGGETIIAREVKAFDPSSQWFKLASGGYVWGGNLLSDDQIAHEAGLSFPKSLQGRWSDRNSCAGTGEDFVISISEAEIDFGTTLYGLVNILSAGDEIPVYELSGIGRDMLPGSKVTLAEDARWPIIWITNGDQANGDRFAYFRSQLACSEVIKIRERLM